MMKLRMKVSGRFRTKRGAEDFAVMRSVADAPRKNDLNVIETLSGSSESSLKAIGIDAWKGEPGQISRASAI